MNDLPQNLTHRSNIFPEPWHEREGYLACSYCGSMETHQLLDAFRSGKVVKWSGSDWKYAGMNGYVIIHSCKNQNSPHERMNNGSESENRPDSDTQNAKWPQVPVELGGLWRPFAPSVGQSGQSQRTVSTSPVSRRTEREGQSGSVDHARNELTISHGSKIPTSKTTHETGGKSNASGESTISDENAMSAATNTTEPMAGLSTSTTETPPKKSSLSTEDIHGSASEPNLTNATSSVPSATAENTPSLINTGCYYIPVPVSWGYPHKFYIDLETGKPRETYYTINVGKGDEPPAGAAPYHHDNPYYAQHGYYEVNAETFYSWRGSGGSGRKEGTGRITAKFYTEHLKDIAAKPEAFTALAEELEKRLGIRFELRDGEIMYRAPRHGYQTWGDVGMPPPIAPNSGPG